MLEEVVKSDEAVSNHSLALDESLSTFFSKQAPIPKVHQYTSSVISMNL